MIKFFLTIVSIALMLSVFFVPSDDASVSTYILWIIGEAGYLYIAKLIWDRLDEWDAEDER